MGNEDKVQPDDDRSFCPRKAGTNFTKCGEGRCAIWDRRRQQCSELSRNLAKAEEVEQRQEDRAYSGSLVERGCPRKGQTWVIEKLLYCNRDYDKARRLVLECGLTVCRTQAEAIAEKVAAIQKGSEAGALGGKNMDERKQAEAEWLASREGYKETLDAAADAEANLAAATRDLDIAKMGIRVYECLAKLLEE